jgi:hypothetical protein
MACIPLPGEQYKDAKVVTNEANLRAWGQKDIVNNKSHLWIDNVPYTWKAFVEHNYRPEPWNSSVTYAKDSTCGSADSSYIYQSIQDNNKNHSLSDLSWWNPVGPFDSANNPPLPSPVSGTVTVSGFNDGIYKIEWWDTTAGVITRTEEASCNNGNIVLTVNELQSDVAVKLSYLRDFDTTAPVISDVTVSDITQTSCKVNWTTDEPATSRVTYGLTSTYGSVVSDATLFIIHSLGITGLTTNTTYHYKITTIDQAGNPAESIDYTFTTTAGTASSGSSASKKHRVWYKCGCFGLEALILISIIGFIKKRKLIVKSIR